MASDRIERIHTRSFVTGSHAYGTPDEESDVDLVILVTEDDLMILRKLATDPHVWAENCGPASWRGHSEERTREGRTDPQGAGEGRSRSPFSDTGGRQAIMG